MSTSALSWLLEADDPGVRYLALRDLMRLDDGDAALDEARHLAHAPGTPIAAVLDAMDPEGFWVQPGAGYGPKYWSAVWALTLLGQLGARIEEDARISTACAYALDHALTELGQFSTNGTPGNTIDCLQGNLCWALTVLGSTDARLDRAYEWMARTVTGEGISPATEKKAPMRYFAAKCGPLFQCGANYGMSCAWGGVKVMMAFGVLPAERHTSLIDRAIAAGAEFLLAGGVATAGYPNGMNERASGNWWKFGFPIFYVTDILQNVEALQLAGFGGDPRLRPALDLVSARRDEAGRWPLEYHYNAKTWVNFGRKGLPNKWVTLRALRALGRAEM
jgi:hypothetical protein